MDTKQASGNQSNNDGLRKNKALPYIPHTDEDVRRMCSDIGIDSIERLIEIYPEELRLKQELNLPPAVSEQKVKEHLCALASKNGAAGKVRASFLGAGAYSHYIPAVVDHVLLQSEFYTAYTPYQPEISQGTLQAIFEYQTLICQLTGMEVSNASLYDGASATAEAVLMANRLTKRSKILVSEALHPEYRETIRTYLGGGSFEVSEFGFDAASGTSLPGELDGCLDDDTACVVLQQPNFFGSIEDLASFAEAVKDRGALLIVVVTEPLSMALIRPPGEFGADIVVGEGQSFGSPLSYGGPYLGFMAVRERLMRQMPGRIVGETTDKDGKRSFCLTLATREQHIRREKATSNICTNQGLVALACAVYLVALGKSGLRELAELNLSKAAYLKERLTELPGIKSAFNAPVFNEFVVEVEGDAESFLGRLLDKGLIGGLSLARFYPKLKGRILVTATETNTREAIEEYVSCAMEALK